MANVVEILVTAKDATREGFAAATAESETFSAKMQKIGLISAVALAGVAVASVDMAAKFDSSMTLLQTQAGVSQAKLAVLKQGVLDLAGQVGFSPDSLAESAYHVASNMESMGATTTQMLGAVKVAAEGAAVGHANLVDVTNALGAAIASQIPGVNNYQKAMGVLNATVGTGDMKMQDLADAFGTGLLATVKGFGLSITDVGAALATFGDNNIRGAKAGTDLRMAVQALAAPTKAGDALLKSFGMTTSQLADDMRTKGLLFALEDLKKHLVAAGVSSTESGQIITEMFGKKAGVGVQVLYNQLDRLASKYPALNAGANGFGAAWTTTQQTLTQRMKEIQASFEATAIEIGNRLMPYVQKLLDFLAQHAGTVSKVAEVILAVAAALAVYALAAKTAAVAAEIFNAVMDANVFVIIGVAIAALALLVIKYHTQIWNFIQKTWSDVSKFVISTWSTIYNTGSQIWNRIYNDTVGVVIRMISDIKNAITSGFDSWWATHGQAVEAVWSKVWSTISSIFTVAWAYLSGQVKIGLAVMQTLWKVAWDLISGIVKVAWDLISGYFKAYFSVIEGVAKSAWDVMVALFRVTWDTIKLILKTAWDVIVGLFSVFLDVINGHWKTAWTDIKATAQQVWNNIRDFLTGIWNALSTAAAQIFGHIKDTVVGIFNTLKSTVAATGTGLFNTGKSVMEDLFNGFKSVWNDIVNFFKGLAKDILNALGIHSPPDWAIQAGKDIMNGLGIGMAQAQGAVNTASKLVANNVKISQGGTAGQIQLLMQQMAAARGWKGQQWLDLNLLEMSEAGYNLTAKNPTSNAYGLAQFINGPSEYYTYGGNPNTASGQITAMLNYIAQRYGNPANAWAHEEAFHWYGSGGPTSSGWAVVGEHGRELVRLPGGSSVTPSSSVSSQLAGAGWGGTITLEIAGGSGSAFDQFMLEWLRENARVKGGGNVQKAFGRN